MSERVSERDLPAAGEARGGGACMGSASCANADGSGVRARVAFTDTSCERYDAVVQSRVYAGGYVVITWKNHAKRAFSSTPHRPEEYRP